MEQVSYVFLPQTVNKRSRKQMTSIAGVLTEESGGLIPSRPRAFILWIF